MPHSTKLRGRGKPSGQINQGAGLTAKLLPSVYKDLVLLVAGALIGIVSGAVATYQQSISQERQSLVDKQYSVLRDLVQQTNEAWQKQDSNLERIRNALDDLELLVSKTDSSDDLAILLPKIEPKIESIKSFMTDWQTSHDSDGRDYEMRFETQITLLSLLLDKDLPLLKFDWQMSTTVEQINLANEKLQSSTVRNVDEWVKVSSLWISEVRAAVAVGRTSVMRRRSEINGQLRLLSKSVLHIR